VHRNYYICENLNFVMPIPIFRITHISNLDYIVNLGKLVCPNHEDRDVDYRAIGNNEIIESRSQRPLPINADRTFKDYVAFYFGPRSIMLYNIQTGYGEVEQVNQEEIIYLVSNIEAICDTDTEYFFTDGHALQHPTTRFFEDIVQLEEVNFADAFARNFSAANEINNPGLKRRKQSEFHVFKELDWNLINEIVVYNQEAMNNVNNILNQAGITKTVRIDTNYYF